MANFVNVWDDKIGRYVAVPSIKGDKGDTGAQGIQGEKGDKGDTGEQGVSVIDVVLDDAGNLFIFLSNGDVVDVGCVKGEKGDKGDEGDTGEQGVQGVQGNKGDDGYTPVKGVDYYTEADKTEMVELVLAALPNGDEVSY